MPGTAFSTSNWNGYDEQSVSNPSSALTDFTLLIDVSRMSSDWKGEVQSDGADIRVTKGDDTEIPYDLIDWAYNAGAPTGWIRCKWSGSLASSGTQNVRVWAGYDAGGSATAYDASETYGSDNAYRSACEAYLPLSSDFNDRTSNSYDGTGGGGISAGSASDGPGSWDATTFDGSNDYVEISGSAAILSDLADASVHIWMKSSTNRSSGYALYCERSSGTPIWKYEWDHNSYQDRSPLFTHRNNAGSLSRIQSVSSNLTGDGNWHLCTLTKDGTTVELYVDGADQGGGTLSGNDTLTATICRIGGDNNDAGADYGGDLHGLMLFSETLAPAEVSHEYDQVDDQATFWGTWSWTASSSGTEGDTAQSLPTLNQSASTKVDVSGTAAQDLPTVEQINITELTVIAATSQLLPSAIQESSSTTLVSASISQQITAIGQSVSVGVSVEAESDQELPPISQAASSSDVRQAAITHGLAAITQSVSVFSTNESIVSQELPSISQLASTTVDISSTVDHELPSLAQSASASIDVKAALVQDLPSISQTATSLVAVDSEVTQSLPAILQQATVLVGVTGAFCEEMIRASVLNHFDLNYAETSSESLAEQPFDYDSASEAIEFDILVGDEITVRGSGDKQRNRVMITAHTWSAQGQNIYRAGEIAQAVIDLFAQETIEVKDFDSAGSPVVGHVRFEEADLTDMTEDMQKQLNTGGRHLAVIIPGISQEN